MAHWINFSEVEISVRECGNNRLGIRNIIQVNNIECIKGARIGMELGKVKVLCSGVLDVECVGNVQFLDEAECVLVVHNNGADIVCAEVVKVCNREWKRPGARPCSDCLSSKCLGCKDKFVEVAGVSFVADECAVKLECCFVKEVNRFIGLFRYAKRLQVVIEVFDQFSFFQQAACFNALEGEADEEEKNKCSCDGSKDEFEGAAGDASFSSDHHVTRGLLLHKCSR